MSADWRQFGLRDNPYDTAPLVEGGSLPIEKAFVARDKEKDFLNDLFLSENKLCLTICGDVGVGKTSLANFHKFIWKHEKPKLLFSSRREIEACDELLTKRTFLIEIIGSVLREIELLQPNLMKDERLKKLNQIVDISQSLAISAGASIAGFGASAGGNKALTQPLDFPVAVLEKYFLVLVDFLQEESIDGKKYSGLIVHVNNFDVVLEENKRAVINFFNEIRDILQTPNVYFMFLGPKNLFKDVVNSQQRVKSVFTQTPLQIKPLSKHEIVKAFDERMEILKSADVSRYIKPVEDRVVFGLYDLFDGDIRLIMAALKDILSQRSAQLGKTLTLDEAKLLLGKARWEKIKTAINLTPEQEKVLLHLAGSDGYISQKQVAELFQKARTNVSGYYFGPLKDNNIIEKKEVKGRTVYWGLSSDYTPLKWLVEGQKAVQEKAEHELPQLSFDL